jgi:hypothetical protein
MISTCGNCGEAVDQPVTGRRRRWCSERCRKAAAKTRALVAVPASGGGGAVSAALDAYIDGLGSVTGDRAVVALLAGQLAVAVDARPGDVTLTRELRLCLAQIADGVGGGAGEVDEEQVRFLQRRVLGLLGGGRR